MINIAKKKLPSAVMIILVYVSYCAMSWYGMRGTMAYYGQKNNWGAWFVNDAWAFFLGGLVPLIFYEFLKQFAHRALAMRYRGSDIDSVCYGLDFAVISANVLLFALKFIFLAVPMYASLLNILLDPIVTVIFVALYMLYVYKQNYVEKYLFRFVLTQIFGLFLIVYGILAFVNIIVVVA